MGKQRVPDYPTHPSPHTHRLCLGVAATFTNRPELKRLLF